MESFKQFMNSQKDVALLHKFTDSSLVTVIIYDFNSNILIIHFNDKFKGILGTNMKVYGNVHVNTILKFIDARSKGAFFKSMIEKQYKELQDFPYINNIKEFSDFKNLYKGA